MMQLDEIEPPIPGFVLADERLGNVQGGSYLYLRQVSFMTQFP